MLISKVHTQGAKMKSQVGKIDAYNIQDCDTVKQYATFLLFIVFNLSEN